MTAFEGVSQSEHQRWVRDIKKLALEASDSVALDQALLEWQTGLPVPDYLDALGDALALADLKGRSEVDDETDDPALADPTIGSVTFTEAQEFLRQKVSLPSKRWTDTLHQAHDRAFVIAGADSVALVDDIRGALTRSIGPDGGGLEAFRKEFDAIVKNLGWDYTGGRNWRTRVIYETNLRTAHQAGRLKQMRDPDVIKLRPYWRYVHGETREPKTPRAEHLAWDGMVFMHDDPIWDTIYPQNGWKCSCGVGTLSKAGLKRLGKDGPDNAPVLKIRKVKDPTTGEWVDVPEGIDFGWGYQPGDKWERGLVPRELQSPLSRLQPDLPSPDSPSLDQFSRPFASDELPAGKSPEFYVDRFLNRFGAAIGNGVMHRDKAGQAVLISEDLFRNADGKWKSSKRSRDVQMERLAEAVFDPDEIWVDWGEEKDGTPRLVRKYLRYDPLIAAFSLFKWSNVGWSGLTSHPATKGRKNKPRLQGLEKERRGVLMYRRMK